MEHTYTDFLFILAIYEDGISLDKLLFHIEPGGDITPAARAEAQQVLEQMERRGLVCITGKNAAWHIRLTASGQKVSNRLAGIMADDMVRHWRSRQLAFPAPGQQAANY